MHILSMNYHIVNITLEYFKQLYFDGNIRVTSHEHQGNPFHEPRDCLKAFEVA